MLTNKIRLSARQIGVLLVCIVLSLLGCTPAGPRALLEGERLLMEGQVNQALDRLQRAVRLIPQNAQAWNHLGLAYHRAGQLNEALQAYQQALTLNPTLSSARFNLGCLYLERGEAAAAIPELSAYVAAEPNATEGWLKLGTVQVRARQTDAAEQSFRQAVHLDQRSAEGLNGLGLVQFQRRRYPEAYQQFQAATRVQPDYAPALRNAAVVAHQHLKNPQVALQRYQELAAIPNVADIESIRSLITQIQDELMPAPKPPVQMAQGQPSSARSSPAAAPATNTPESQSSSRSAAASVGTANADSAVTNATKPAASPKETTSAPPSAVASAPRTKPRPAPAPTTPREPVVTPAPQPAPVPEQSVTVSEPPIDSLSPFPRYRYRTLSKPRAGDRAAAERAVAEGFRAHTRYRYAEAIAAYQRAIQEDPSLFEAHYNLGVAAYENGDPSLALSSYEMALALDPSSLRARFNFASTLEQSGYYRDAADELERLVVRHDEEARVHAALANLYANKLKDPGRARSHYQRVLELDPRHPDAMAIRYWLERNR